MHNPRRRGWLIHSEADRPHYGFLCEEADMEKTGQTSGKRFPLVAANLINLTTGP